MDIIIKKDIKDPRVNRDQTLKKGTELTVSRDAVWMEIVKEKKAVIKKPLVTKVLKTVDEAEKYNNENQE